MIKYLYMSRSEKSSKTAERLPLRSRLAVAGIAVASVLTPALARAAEQKTSPNAQARHFATRLGGRVIDIYKAVRKGERPGKAFTVPPQVGEPEQNGDKQWLDVVVDSGKSRIKDASSKYEMKVLVDPDKNGKVHGRDVETVTLTEGKSGTFSSNLGGLAIVSLYKNGAGSWNFYGEYATNGKPSHREMVSTSTSGSDHMTTEMLYEANLQMDGIIDDALAGEPTDYLKPPFNQ